MARRLTATAALACTLLIACSAASASSSALAADAEDLPSFEVGASSDEYPGLTLSLEGTDEDGYPGRFRITVPSGFDLYPERPAGSLVGLAFLIAGDSSSSSSGVSLLEGQIVAQANPPTDPAAHACSPGDHEAVWSLNLSLLGQLLEVPIYISKENGGLTLDLCVPPVTSGGPLLPVEALHLILPELRAPRTKGVYTWRAVVTPTAPDRHTLLPNNAYELRALVPIPNHVALHSRYDPKTHTAILHGAVQSAGKPRAGATVIFTSLIRKVTPRGVEYHDAYAGWARTDAAGGFLFRKRITRTTGFIASVPSFPTACTDASTAPAGCRSTTTAATRSEPVTVSVPRH